VDGNGANEELDRVTVAEAAERLGVKEQAIRKRIARGTLPHDKEPDGRVYVYIDVEAEDEVQGSSARDDTHLEALVESLQDQVRFLREELARKDALMLNMTETMRQLTAPADEGSPEARESPESPGPTRTPTDAGGGPQTATERRFTEEPEPRSWWRRMFGG
jgi:hypothetical protein